MSNQLQLANQEFTPRTLQKHVESRSEVTALRLHLNYCPFILRQLPVHRQKLNKLQVLNLGYNNIGSVEPLQHLELKDLTHLHLFANKITSLRALRKCSMPRLVFLSLADNSLASLEGVSELDCPRLTQLQAYDNQLSQVGSLVKSGLDLLASIGLGQIEEVYLTQVLLSVRFPAFFRANFGPESEQSEQS